MTVEVRGEVNVMATSRPFPRKRPNGWTSLGAPTTSRPSSTTSARTYFSDDESSALQQSLLANPEAGAVIPGSGGVRKLRWGVAGRGKRGGVRVIYYVRSRLGQVWMLTLYAKSVSENIPAHVLKKIKEEIDGQDQD